MTLKDPLGSLTHLFTVRVWLENLGESGPEWRGKVQHVLSKEVRYFQGWPMLIAILQELSIRTEDETKDVKEI